MSLTQREFWTAIHGMVLGGIFIVAYAGGLAELWGLRPQWLTEAGLRARIRRLQVITGAMAVTAWATFLLGILVIFPWYRTRPPDGTTGAALAAYPRYFLLADPQTAAWHTFAMEWKEYVSIFSPILATAVAFVAVGYGPKLANDTRVRQALIVLFTVAFLVAVVLGLLGAFINKMGPVR